MNTEKVFIAKNSLSITLQKKTKKNLLKISGSIFTVLMTVRGCGLQNTLEFLTLKKLMDLEPEALFITLWESMFKTQGGS